VPYDPNYDDVDRAWLFISYARRLDFQNRTLAVRIINTVGEAMSGTSAGGQVKDRLPAELMIAQMGGFSS